MKGQRLREGVMEALRNSNPVLKQLLQPARWPHDSQNILNIFTMVQESYIGFMMPSGQLQNGYG